MDLKEYYRKIAEQEAQIAEEFPLTVSVKTETGGKEGRITEVPRKMAAKLVVENRARLATAEEAAAYRAEEARLQHERELANLQERFRMAAIAAEELRLMRASLATVTQNQTTEEEE